jgi:putative FmdB family regulatory protein
VVPYHWQSPVASASRPRRRTPARAAQLRPEDPALPTYQYRCTDCGHAFEQFQSFTDDALTTCPECGGTLRKVYNAVGVVFKGSGFYRNDSRQKSSTSDTPAATSGDSASPSPSPKAPDSSPATSTSSSSTSTPASTGSSTGG